MTHRHGRPVRGGAAGFVHLLGLGAALGALLPGAAHAQFVEAPAPAAYALQNVTVVHADGATATGQTVVVRAGRIHSIGRLPSVPADAQLLAGDSLYVYPGLIDGAGMVKFEFPRDTTRRDQIQSWDAPRSVQGFMPSRRVVDHLVATGRDVADLRKQGVVAVAVHPSLTEPLMPGRGTLLLLRGDAARPQQLVVEPALAPLLTLRGGRGVYPATGMAVLQWYRQLFMDAARAAQLTQVASANPRAVIPPPHDPDMVVVQEMLRSQGRVFLAANSAEEIRRVLRLAGEFRLRPVIVGGAEAWRVAAELKAGDVPVLVNVDFPTPRRWKPDAPDTAAAAQAPAVVRERQQFEAQYANAAKLAQAGVPFALVSGGSGDLRAGVRKVIEHGLTEAAALRALTLTPAAIYGVPHLGRIEAGLPASFVVSDRPLFSEDARVLYTFVDGVLERGAQPRRGNGAAADSAGAVLQVAGRWSGEVVAGEAQQFTMRLSQEGSTVSGTAQSQTGTMQLSGSVEGSRITLNATLTMGGQSVPLTFRGTIDGDSMSGDIDSPMGSLPWSARRTGPEDR